jgi:sulfotransferase family protein
MYPNFLGIGAQKSGTTWLHDNLARHPQVWLPPVKEIHYFDRPDLSLGSRLFGDAERLCKGRALLRESAWGWIKGTVESRDLAWAWKYAVRPRSDEWYGSLFGRRSGMLTGEICPGYARLPTEVIQRIRRLMPEGRIIYLLRHPIERAWSAAVMHFNDRGRSDYRGISPVELDEWLRRPKTIEHAMYSSAIERWRGVFEDRLFIGFYDELCRDPARLLSRIQAFIGVRQDVPADVSAQRNAGNWTHIPERFIPLLEELFEPELQRLHKLLNHPITLDWLNRDYRQQSGMAAAPAEPAGKVATR